MSNNYSVVMTGELVEGFELESVQSAFSEVFKLSKEKVQNYFNGNPRILKKEVDHQTAFKYKARIEKVGASVELHRVTPNLSAEKILSEISRRKHNAKKTQTRLDVIENDLVNEVVNDKATERTTKSSSKGTTESTAERTNDKVRPEIVFEEANQDNSVNLIELGRIRQSQKIGRIELADEPTNFWLMMFGFVFIILGIADFALYSLNIFTLFGNVYLDAGSILIGLVFLKSGKSV